MPKVTYIDYQDNSKTIEVENGLTVMEGAIQNDISGIDADCGGSMACATCHVYVEEKWFNKLPKAEEAEVFQKTHGLLCCMCSVLYLF